MRNFHTVTTSAALALCGGALVLGLAGPAVAATAPERPATSSRDLDDDLDADLAALDASIDKYVDAILANPTGGAGDMSGIQAAVDKLVADMRQLAPSEVPADVLPDVSDDLVELDDLDEDLTDEIEQDLADITDEITDDDATDEDIALPDLGDLLGRLLDLSLIEDLLGIDLPSLT
ncbi:hypothetical protein ACH44C_09965 [Streptomyces purpureus]|uniref:hypothetical protein n=1 Tax=Streptomyces purpureus TaxID=1951 RepID=UPI00378C3B64